MTRAAGRGGPRARCRTTEGGAMTSRCRRRLLERLRRWLARLPLIDLEGCRDLQESAAAGAGASRRRPGGRLGEPRLRCSEGAVHGGRDRGGRDRRTAQEYAADLASETDRSLRRDPERWTRRRTNELPKDRSTEPQTPP